ncbi:porin family protein [bacterium]|nr:porin family protein [bacterium]
MHKSLAAAAALVLVLALASGAGAKDLTNRISVGYNNQINFGYIGGPNAALADAFFTQQAISSRYWINDLLGVEPMFGYFTAKNDDVGGWALQIAAKVVYNLIMEENMNFYGGGGLGIIPMSIDYGRKEVDETGFLLMGFAGMEFFLEGLPNLAFDVEFGLQYIDIDTYAQISTFGGGFGVMGIRYYF